jgi:hypothetical protein
MYAVPPDETVSALRRIQGWQERLNLTHSARMSVVEVQPWKTHPPAHTQIEMRPIGGGWVVRIVGTRLGKWGPTVPRAVMDAAPAIENVIEREESRVAAMKEQLREALDTSEDN